MALKGRLGAMQRKVVRYILNLGPRETLSVGWLPFPRCAEYFSMVHVLR